MNTTKIITELKTERDRIEHAIAAIEGLTSTGRRRAGRPPRAAATGRTRRRLSTAARRKLSRLLKERWAQGKMKPKTTAKPARTSKPKRRRVSREARKRMAAAQRARWARVKAQQAQKKTA